MPMQRALLLATLVSCAACAGAGTGSDTTATAAQANATAGNATAAVSPAPAPSSAAKSAPAPKKQFPGLDYLKQIPYAYRVASEHPGLLAKIPCYCPCELYGHGGVLDCYRSQHAAGCATCLEEGVLAGQLLEQAGGEDSEQVYQQIAAEVKKRYRTAIVRSYLQRNEMPNLQTPGGRAFLNTCSECHQPPHPAMYTADGWRRSLARMDAYTHQRDLEVDPAQWQAAVDYIRAASSQFPPSAGEQYRQRLAEAVDHLKAAEGESVYYPGPQDKVLNAEWFERMVGAYRLARDIPADVLAATEVDDPACRNLLECLNSTAAVTSEAAVEAVYRLAAKSND